MNTRTRLLCTAVIVLAGCTSPTLSHTPAPPASGSPAPSTTPEASPTAIAGASMCTADQLTLAAGRIEGAAGTTYLAVDVRLKGTEPCSISRWPAIDIVDSAGDVVVHGDPVQNHALELRELTGDAIYSIGWSSWCGAVLPEPLTAVISFVLSAPEPRLELPDAYAPSGCLGSSSNVFVQPA